MTSLVVVGTVTISEIIHRLDCIDLSSLSCQIDLYTYLNHFVSDELSDMTNTELSCVKNVVFCGRCVRRTLATCAMLLVKKAQRPCL